MVFLLLLAVSTAAGMALGLRYNVLVLVPAIAASLTIGFLSLAVAHTGRWATVAGIIGLLTTLQVGYVVGTLLRGYSPEKLGVPSRRNDWAIPTKS